MNVGAIGRGSNSFRFPAQNLLEKSGRVSSGQEIPYDKPFTLKADGLFSTGRPTGESLTVYRSKEYSDANPVYLVKGTDKDGKEYEEKININQVNPENCSYVEMITLKVHLEIADKSDYSVAGLMDLSMQEHNDYFSKQNFMPSLYYMRECQKSACNLLGYTKYDGLIKSLMRHCNKNNLL